MAYVPAWDLPTRVFHWTLVTLVATSWVTAEFSEAIGDPTLRWHRWSGYVLLVVIVWRVIWGFVGASTSRFATFLRWPSDAAAHVGRLLTGPPTRYLGHNPLGAYMVVLLLGAIALQAMLGLVTVEHNDLTAGPLYRLVPTGVVKLASSWHVWMLTGLLLPLILLHVAVNAFYTFVKREPLIPAMVHGAKPAVTYQDQQAAIVPQNWALRAFLCLAAATALVFVPLALFGGRL